MTRSFNFEGKEYSFPDDVSDEEALSFIDSNSPKKDTKFSLGRDVLAPGLVGLADLGAGAASMIAGAVAKPTTAIAGLLSGDTISGAEQKVNQLLEPLQEPFGKAIEKGLGSDIRQRPLYKALKFPFEKISEYGIQKPGEIATEVGGPELGAGTRIAAEMFLGTTPFAKRGNVNPLVEVGSPFAPRYEVPKNFAKPIPVTREDLLKEAAGRDKPKASEAYPEEALLKAEEPWNEKLQAPQLGLGGRVSKIPDQIGKEKTTASQTAFEKGIYEDKLGQERKLPEGIKSKQGGYINPEVFKEGFEKAKELVDKGIKLVAKAYPNKEDPRFNVLSISAIDKEGKRLGIVDFGIDKTGKPLAEANLESFGTTVDAAARRQGLATEMYKFAQELGNDVITSNYQSKHGKAMWAGFEEKGMVNEQGILPRQESSKISPLGGLGKKQGGALGFSFKKKGDLPYKDFEEFAKEAEKQGISRKAAAETWSEHGGRIEATVPNASLTAMTKVPGMQRLANTLDDTRPYEEVQSTILKEPDVSGIKSKVGGLIGLNERAATTKSTGYRWGLAGIKRIKAQYDLIKEKAFGEKGTGFASELHKFADLNRDDFIDLWQKLRENEGKMEGLQLNERQQKLLAHKESIQKAFEAELTPLLKSLGKEAEASRIGRPNYLPDNINGPWIVEAFKINKDGTKQLVWITGESNVWKARKARTWLEKQAKQNPELKVSGIQHKPDLYDSLYSGGGAFSRIQAFEEAFKLMAETPEGQSIFQAKRAAEKQAAYDYMGFKERFLAKGEKPKILSAGNQPWRDLYDNAINGWDNWIKVIESGYEWISYQKGKEHISKIVDDPAMYEKPQLKNQLKLALDDSHGVTGRDVNYVLDKLVIENLGFLTGTNKSTIKSVLNEAKNIGIMKFLALSPRFLGTQHIQPATVVPWWLLHLKKEYGLKGSAKMAYWNQLRLQADMQLNMIKYYVKSLPTKGVETTKFNFDEFIGNYDPFTKEALQYAKDNHIITPHILDSVAGTLKNPTYAGAKESIGALMMQSEVATRGPAFVAYATYLFDSGYSKADAFRIAAEATKLSMVDYNPANIPRIYQELGYMGNSAVALARFKHNQFWQQFYMWSRDNKTPAVGMAITQLMLAGLSGFFAIQGADIFFNLFQSIGLVDKDADKPSSWIAKNVNVPDWLSYGPLSKATGFDWSTAFSAAEPLPEDTFDFLFPALGDYPKIAESGFNLGKQIITGDDTKQDYYSLLWNLAPSGVLKGMVEEAFSEKRMIEGQEVLDVPDPKAPGKRLLFRTEADQKARLLGGRSLREAKDTNISFRMKEKETRINERKKYLSDRYKSLRDSGKPVGEVVVEYQRLGGSPEELNNSYLEDKALTSKTDRQASALPGQEITPNLLRKFKERSEYERR